MNLPLSFCLHPHAEEDRSGDVPLSVLVGIGKIYSGWTRTPTHNPALEKLLVVRTPLLLYLLHGFA